MKVVPSLMIVSTEMVHSVSLLLNLDIENNMGGGSTVKS
jgi:hypothetical protein